MKIHLTAKSTILWILSMRKELEAQSGINLGSIPMVNYCQNAISQMQN